MSLINQMLRDLESRNLKKTEAPESLQHTIQIKQNRALKLPRSVVWALLLFAAIGGTYWSYQYSNQLVSNPAPAAESPKPVTPQTTTPTEPKSNPAGITTKPDQTAPVQPPIEPIAALPVNPAPEPLAINKEPPVVQVTTPTSVQTPVHPLTTEHPPEQKTNSEVITVPVAESSATVVPLSIKKQSAIPPGWSKQTSTKQRAELLFHQAENNQEDYSTIAKLEQVLALDPKYLAARLLLTKILYNHGQVGKTASLLDQSLALFPDNLQFINTRAQLFLQQHNPRSALSTLQRINAGNIDNETYLSLLAASYQQLQLSANAAKIYQHLVSMNPEKAEYWLGFALTQENQGNLKLAREAYNQALSKSALKDSITRFIRKRLTELK